MRLLVWAVLLLATLIAIDAKAHDFTFTWDDPTARTDGSRFSPNEELQSYRLRCEGPENAAHFIDRSVTQPVEGQTRRYVWRNAVEADGVYDCSMIAIDTMGLESEWSESATVSKFLEIAPPTGFRRATDTFVRQVQSHVFYGEETVETTLRNVPENALILAHMWHRVSPTHAPEVEGWELAYHHSVYPNASSDRRGTALFWKQATRDTIPVRARWEGNREFHLVIQVYEGAGNWNLEAVRVADNGGSGSTSLPTGNLSVSRPSLAVASWGSRELLDNVQAPVMDGFSALALGTEAGQYSMGAAIGYSRQFTNGGFTLGFSSSRAVSGLAIFSYGD